MNNKAAVKRCYETNPHFACSVAESSRPRDGVCCHSYWTHWDAVCPKDSDAFHLQNIDKEPY